MPFRSKEREKEYQRQWHLKNWARRKERHMLLKNKRKQAQVNWFKEYKLTLHCSECQETHPACLDFHHIDPHTKTDAVAQMIQKAYSLKTIQKEIAKCIVLCRNCHAKTHYVIKDNSLIL